MNADLTINFSYKLLKRYIFINLSLDSASVIPFR